MSYKYTTIIVITNYFLFIFRYSVGYLYNQLLFICLKITFGVAHRPKDWYYQHFNYSHFHKLMEMSSSILFLMGEQDEEYLPMKKRFEEMKLKGKKNISFYSISVVGHGTIASTNQEPLFSIIDKLLEHTLVNGSSLKS